MSSLREARPTDGRKQAGTVAPMILADTSALLASIDPRDPANADAIAFLRGLRQPAELVIPSPVLGELGYWVGTRLGAPSEAALLRRLAGGAWQLQAPTAADLLRAAELVEQYASFPLGTVDALIVAIAERLAVTTIFTLDRRHFGAVRPRHCDSFELVP